jgi:hypothetical protein
VWVSEMQTTRTAGLFRGGLNAGPRKKRRKEYKRVAIVRNGDSSILSRAVGGSHLSLRRAHGHGDVRTVFGPGIGNATLRATASQVRSAIAKNNKDNH